MPRSTAGKQPFSERGCTGRAEFPCEYLHPFHHRGCFTGTPEPEERDYFSAVPSSFICSTSANVLIGARSLNAMETPGHIVRSSASTFFILRFLFKNCFLRLWGKKKPTQGRVHWESFPQLEIDFVVSPDHTSPHKKREFIRSIPSLVKRKRAPKKTVKQLKCVLL